MIGECRRERLDVGVAGLGHRDGVRAHEGVDVVLVLDEGQGPGLFGAEVLVKNVFRLRRAGIAPAGALPVVTQFPELPETVGVVFLDGVRADRYRRCIVEGRDAIAERLEDVLGRRRELGTPSVDAEHGLDIVGCGGGLDLEGVVVDLLPSFHIVDIAGDEIELVLVFLGRVERVDEVVGGQFDAVAPVDALAQLDAELGVVVVQALRQDRQPVRDRTAPVEVSISQR